MSLEQSLFYVLAAVTAASALGVALSRSVIHSAVWLLFTLIGVSLLYLLMGAEFLAGTQLIVYVGGTMVLVVFGVMLTSGGPYAVIRSSRTEIVIAALVATLLAGMTVVAALTVPHSAQPVGTLPNTSAIGVGFLGVDDAASPHRLSYLLPFEIVSVHLLVVLIGAAYLARAKKRLRGPT